MIRKAMGESSSVMRGMAIGMCMGLLAMLGFSAICATMIAMEIVVPNAENYCTVVILLICTFIAASIAARRTNGKRLLVCMFTGVVMFLVLLSMTAMFFGGQYRGVGMTSVFVFLGSIIAGFAGLRDRKRGNSHKSKIRHR